MKGESHSPPEVVEVPILWWEAREEGQPQPAESASAITPNKKACLEAQHDARFYRKFRATFSIWQVN
jgi:hypothetical protein